MVRRGSTVRVRQRALQKRRTSALSRSGRLAPRPTCDGYGAVYGAFASTTWSLGAESGASRVAFRPSLVMLRPQASKAASRAESSISEHYDMGVTAPAAVLL